MTVSYLKTYSTYKNVELTTSWHYDVIIVGRRMFFNKPGTSLKQLIQIDLAGHFNHTRWSFSVSLGMAPQTRRAVNCPTTTT